MPGLKKLRVPEANIFRQASSHHQCSQGPGTATNPAFPHLEDEKKNDTPTSQDCLSLPCPPNMSGLPNPVNTYQDLKGASSLTSCLGLNEIVFLNVLAQSLANENHLLKISFLVTIITRSQSGFERGCFDSKASQQRQSPSFSLSSPNVLGLVCV